MDISDFTDPMWEPAQTAIFRKDLDAYQCPHCSHIMKKDDDVLEGIEGEDFRCPQCMNELRIIE